MGTIESYHAHVYFDENTVEKAQKICERVSEKFDLQMGRLHEKNVGPHPRWSCQVFVEKGKFGRVIPWLMKNRDGLTVFVHPNTGNELIDHTDFALWMGEMLPLKLDMF